MNFDITKEQQSLNDHLTAFARDNLSDGVDERDAFGTPEQDAYRSLWAKVAESGVLKIAAPAEFGGQALDPTSLALALEAFGYGCPDAGLCLGLSGQILAVQKPIEEFATQAQKAETLPDLLSGKRIGVICLTEPDAGSDVTSMQTTATRDGDDFLINGQKHYIGNATYADVGLVFAKTAPERGSWGISVFMVDLNRDGVERDLAHDKMGTRSLPMGRIQFNDLRVSGADMMGSPGSGASIFQRALDWERGLVFSAPLGAMRRQLEDCVTYASERTSLYAISNRYQTVWLICGCAMKRHGF